jgi:hypothetical protein
MLHATSTYPSDSNFPEEPDFYASDDGATFCVLHGANVGWGVYGTNAFVYSQRLRLSRDYKFEKRPGKVTFDRDHVFLYFEHDGSGYDVEVASGSLSAFPPSRGATTGLGGSETSQTQYGGFQARSGRWIFFEGPDSPFRGTRLVSSASNRFGTGAADTKPKDVRVLKRFVQPLRGDYTMMQLSPTMDYVLVRKSLPSGDGWEYTYYVVNAETGETSLLLEDTVAAVKAARVSEMRWVASPGQGPPREK